MSDPIEKLAETCKLLGDECHELVKERKEKHIGDMRFVNKYFQLLEKMDKGKKREEVISDLESYAKKELKRDNIEWLK